MPIGIGENLTVLARPGSSASGTASPSVCRKLAGFAFSAVYVTAIVKNNTRPGEPERAVAWVLCTAELSTSPQQDKDALPW